MFISSTSWCGRSRVQAPLLTPQSWGGTDPNGALEGRKGRSRRKKKRGTLRNRRKIVDFFLISRNFRVHSAHKLTIFRIFESKVAPKKFFG